MQTTVRTRIAPSPTGNDIHIGNLYTALINYAWAKKNTGKFVVRIEDTDRERYVKSAEKQILQSIKAYELTPDESPEKGGPFAPYRQSERLPLYKKYAEELIEKGKAYYCFCSKKRLEELRKKQIADKKTPRYDKLCKGIRDLPAGRQDYELRIKNGEPHVIRLDVPQDQTITFADLIRGDIAFDSNTIDDQVLMKSDGYPTYHLAVVVDDHLMEISHVIRAEEWISSTPKHVLLYRAFGWDLPIFVHVPILRNPDKSKLSKRKNPVWSKWYLDEGFLPEAMLNYLALMGWSHPEEKEIFSLEEFISLFDLKDMKPAGPVFDIVKLRWMNQQYIQMLSNIDLRNKLIDFYRNNDVIYRFLSGKSEIGEENVNDVLDLVKTRMETLRDFEKLTSFVFVPPQKDKLNEGYFSVVPELLKALDKVSEAEWKADKIFDQMKGIMSEKRSVRMPVFYVIFTGDKRGIPLPNMLQLLGKKEVIRRLNSLRQ